jgi:transcriptional regulator with GAF, ATPase, and Fis domain
MVSGTIQIRNPSPDQFQIAIITGAANFRKILNQVPLLAESDLPVLLRGEPGTGKELVARDICALNYRRQPGQVINCACLTESLAGSELFGHLRGAFTDARSYRPGKFLMANGGTLFLDEIGDLPLSIQAKLLRAVEQGEIEPVGGDKAVKVDVRLVSATNQDMSRLIKQGLFRQDLYDRLAVLEIFLPPLREREGDVVLLAQHFAWETSRLYGLNLPVQFTPGALDRLQRYTWPGNVRELKNVISRAVLLHRGDRITREDIHFTSRVVQVEPPARGASRLAIPVRPSRGQLMELLNEERGNISSLSRRLKVSTKTLYRWLRSYQIDLINLRDWVAYLN